MSSATSRRAGIIDAMFSSRSSSEVCKDDDFDLEPLPENSYGEFGDFQLVGHGEQTNDFCGKFFCFKGCLRVDLHNMVRLDGEIFRGKVFVRRVRFSCGKPSCPVCFKSGWAVREAENIKNRLKESSKRFGRVEHLCVSVPSKDYGLDLKALRHKVIKMLKKIGVVGGCLIFHGFRYNLRQQWYWSPHFHVLGFILGGYARCRHCKGGDCYACDGFEGKCYKCYWDTGYIIRVLGKRKTVFGTAWYQLNHSSVKKGVKRFHVAMWYGVCSYRKLKITKKYRKEVCPICQHDLVWIRYMGVRDLNYSGERDTFEDFEENGLVAWVERVRKRSVSGSPVRVFKGYDARAQ